MPQVTFNIREGSGNAMRAMIWPLRRNHGQPSTTTSSLSLQEDLSAKGFRPFTTVDSKGHTFAIWLKPPTGIGRTAWKTAVVSCDTINLATAYVAPDGVLRASVPVAEPLGHLLFRAETKDGRPVAAPGFVCKFGFDKTLNPRPR